MGNLAIRSCLLSMMMSLFACANHAVEPSEPTPSDEGVSATAGSEANEAHEPHTQAPKNDNGGPIVESSQLTMAVDAQTALVTGSFLFEGQRISFGIHSGDAAFVRIGMEPLAEWTLTSAELPRVIGRIGPYSLFGDERDIDPAQVRACREGLLVIELRDRLQSVGVEELRRQFGPSIGVLLAAGNLIAP